MMMMIMGQSFQDELSTTAGMDSSMDEEGDESSLDAMCAQSTADSGISMSPITSSNTSQPVPSPASSKNSPTHDALRQDNDSADTLPEHIQPAAQQDTGTSPVGHFKIKRQTNQHLNWESN